VHVAVVVPCYKVERSIKTVVEGIPQYIKSIILVDDASPGETPQILDQLATENPGRFFVVHLPQNQGVGGATMAGWDQAVQLDAEIIVKMDGDGQMDPEYLPDLLEPLLYGRADYSKGDRFATPEILKKMPKVRLLGNAGLSFLNRLASGYWKTLDPTNGYFAIRAELIPRLTQQRISKRYFFESSLLIELGLLRAVVRDVPMRTIYGDEKSHLSIGKTLFEFPPKLFVGFLRRILYNKCLFDTTPDFLLGSVGLPLLLFGLSWGIIKYIQFTTLGIPATAGTVMFAALPSILGFQMCLTAIQMDFQSVPSIPLTHPIIR
jgi:glycosyltransferase involved in cell wall biosynthesis